MKKFFGFNKLLASVAVLASVMIFQSCLDDDDNDYYDEHSKKTEEKIKHEKTVLNKKEKASQKNKNSKGLFNKFFKDKNK